MKALYCGFSKQSALSIFFTLDDKGEDSGDFFNFLDQDNTKEPRMVDLSKLVGFAAHMKSDMITYVGSDTMPKCTQGICWYLYLKQFKITKKQLDLLRVDKVQSNVRATNLSGPKGMS